MVVAVLLTLIIEHGPELDGCHRLYQPHDGREGVVEFEHQRIGLQVGLARHDARCESFLPHPGNDSTYRLYRHIVVVAAVLDEVFLRRVGLPAVHQVNLFQLSHHGLGLWRLDIHISRLQQVVERVLHTDAVFRQRTLFLGLNKLFYTRGQRLFEEVFPCYVHVAVLHRRDEHHDDILAVLAPILLHIFLIGHDIVSRATAGKGLCEGDPLVLILHVAQFGHVEGL